MPKTISKKTQNMNLKPLLLILGHMFRKPEVNDPIFADSIDTIRKLSPQLIGLLLGVAQELQQMNMKGMSPKKVPGKTIE